MIVGPSHQDSQGMSDGAMVHTHTGDAGELSAMDCRSATVCLWPSVLHVASPPPSMTPPKHFDDHIPFHEHVPCLRGNGAHLVRPVHPPPPAAFLPSDQVA